LAIFFVAKELMYESYMSLLVASNLAKEQLAQMKWFESPTPYALASKKPYK